MMTREEQNSVKKGEVTGTEAVRNLISRGFNDLGEVIDVMMIADSSSTNNNPKDDEKDKICNIDADSNQTLVLPASSPKLTKRKRKLNKDNDLLGSYWSRGPADKTRQIKEPERYHKKHPSMWKTYSKPVNKYKKLNIRTDYTRVEVEEKDKDAMPVSFPGWEYYGYLNLYAICSLLQYGIKLSMLI